MRAHRYMDERLRRRVDPSDVVQITFLEAQRDLHGFRGSSPAEFGAWLKNILRNNLATAVAQHVTTQKRSLNREANPVRSPDAGSGETQWIASLPAKQSSPSGKAIRMETALELLSALHQLPENQAEAIRLRYIEGLTLIEIVERMDKSDTAVAGLLKRGLQKLRTLLVPPDQEGPAGPSEI